MPQTIRGIGLYDRFIPADEISSFCYRSLSKGNLPDWEKRILQFLLEFMGPADFITQHSSGTTGKPKNFALPKKSMMAAASGTIEMLELHEGQHALLCLPIDYIAGKMMVVRSLVAGLNLHWVEPKSLPPVSGLRTIDFCAMVPLQVLNLLDKHNSLLNIQTLIIGGSEISESLENRLRLIPGKIYETFGMAETCSHIALRRINGSLPERCFTLLRGIKISTDDRNCLTIDAPYLTNRIITNDVVAIIQPEKFCWKGRIDNLINSGGIKVNPEELEKQIYDILGHEVCIVGIPDARLGQKLVMVTDRSHSKEEAGKVLKGMKSLLPAYHVPTAIITMKSLPRNESFKIDRKELAARIARSNTLK